MMLIGRRMNMRENAWVGKGWKIWKCVGVKMNGVNKGSSISSSMLMEWFENESVRKRCSDAMTHTLWVMLSKNLVFNLALHVVLNILGVWTSFVLLEVEDGCRTWNVPRYTMYDSYWWIILNMRRNGKWGIAGYLLQCWNLWEIGWLTFLFICLFSFVVFLVEVLIPISFLISRE